MNYGDKMKVNRVLAVGAHPDDVEFGCGGTLLLLKEKGVDIRYIAFSKCTDLARNVGIEKEWKAAVKLLGLTDSTASLLDFPNRQLFTKEGEIREALEDVRDTFCPDLVFTHSLDDIHQDHTTVREETRKVFKCCTVLGYESPRSSVLFSPSVFVVIPVAVVSQKVRLVGCYRTQQKMPYANPDKLKAALQHYGTKIDAGYAEAFALIRGVFRFGEG